MLYSLCVAAVSDYQELPMLKTLPLSFVVGSLHGSAVCSAQTLLRNRGSLLRVLGMSPFPGSFWLLAELSFKHTWN